MMIAEAQFNRSTLDCMTALRRRLKQAMGVTVRLAEPNAVEQMIDLSKTCEDDDVRELGLRLAEMVTPEQAAASQEATPAVQGAIAAMRQRLASNAPTETLEAAPAADTGKPGTKVRIYRGQVIRQ